MLEGRKQQDSFTIWLMHYIINPKMPGNLRQAASVFLKNYLTEQWTGANKTPVLPQQLKLKLRHQLFHTLVHMDFRDITVQIVEVLIAAWENESLMDWPWLLPEICLFFNKKRTPA